MSDKNATNSTATTSKPRGFATLSPERRSEISRLGGQSAHAQGTAHEFTSDEARHAGRRGGIASGKARRARAVKP